MPADSPLSPEQEKAVEEATRAFLAHQRDWKHWHEKHDAACEGQRDILRALVLEVVQPVEKERDKIAAAFKAAVPGLPAREAAHDDVDNGYRIEAMLDLEDILEAKDCADVLLRVQALGESEKAGAALAACLQAVQQFYSNEQINVALLAWSQRTPTAPAGK